MRHFFNWFILIPSRRQFLAFLEALYNDNLGTLTFESRLVMLIMWILLLLNISLNAEARGMNWAFLVIILNIEINNDFLFSFGPFLRSRSKKWTFLLKMSFSNRNIYSVSYLACGHSLKVAFQCYHRCPHSKLKMHFQSSCG